jgi:hypothetical protein
MALNPWLLGRQVTTLTARVQTLNESTGALANAGGGSPGITDLSDLTAAGVIDEVRLIANRETDNISPVNSSSAHHVPIKVGFSMVLTEILRTAANATLLLNIYTSGVTNYVVITFTRGAHTWSGTFLMTAYDETIQRGKNVARLTVSSVDNADINYA